jgi:hypothetical protein
MRSCPVFQPAAETTQKGKPGRLARFRLARELARAWLAPAGASRASKGFERSEVQTGWVVQFGGQLLVRLDSFACSRKELI